MLRAPDFEERSHDPHPSSPLPRTGRRRRRAVRGRPRARVRRFLAQGSGRPPGAGPLRLPGPDARLQGLGGRAARPDREVDRDVPARVAGARAHHGERRQGRLGPDRALRGRHLGRGAAPADRAAGRRPGHQRHRRDQRRHHRRAAEVPLVVPLPRAGGRRHRALGSLRADHGQAGGGAARRQRCGRCRPTDRACAATSARPTRRRGSRRLRDTFGCKAFKIRLGTPGGRNKDAAPGRSEAIIPAVRKAVGPDIELHADANSCYTPDVAIAMGRRLEDARYAAFEEPCPYWELEWTQRSDAARSRSTSRAASRTTTWRSGAA